VTQQLARRDRSGCEGVALCVRMQIPVRLAAGRHLFVTHSQPRARTVRNATRISRSLAAHSCPTSNPSLSLSLSLSLFLCLAARACGSSRCPPRFLPPRISEGDLGDRVPCHNYLPPSSRSGTFVRVAASIATAAASLLPRMYFSINYAAVP